MSLTIRLENSLFQGQKRDAINLPHNHLPYNLGQKWLGQLSWITYPPFPLINVGNVVGFLFIILFFFNKKGKNHLIINIVSGGRRELASCPNFFVWDCSSVILVWDSGARFNRIVR